MNYKKCLRYTETNERNGARSLISKILPFLKWIFEKCPNKSPNESRSNPNYNYKFKKSENSKLKNTLFNSATYSVKIMRAKMVALNGNRGESAKERANSAQYCPVALWI